MASGLIGGVVFRINGPSNAVVLAARMNGRRVGKAAHVLAHRLLCKQTQVWLFPADSTKNIQWHPARQHLLGQGRPLQHQKPVVVGPGESHVGSLEHFQSWRDVKHCGRMHVLRMISCHGMPCHAMRDHRDRDPPGGIVQIPMKPSARSCPGPWRVSSS